MPVPMRCRVQGEQVWQALLQFAVAERLDAVIDCGALLAGTSNRYGRPGLAHSQGMLPTLQSPASTTPSRCIPPAPCAGVPPSSWCRCCWRRRRARHSDGTAASATTMRARGQWMVLDLQGRRLSRASSPIQEAQVFTLFDEARCRGADLRLRGDAVGLLTLGPATCKDKLMQVGREGVGGAGRHVRGTHPRGAAAHSRLARSARPDSSRPAPWPRRPRAGCASWVEARRCGSRPQPTSLQRSGRLLLPAPLPRQQG